MFWYGRSLHQYMQFIGNRLHIECALREQTIMAVEATVELLEFVFRTTNFQGGKFYQQKEEMAKGSTWSPAVS